jgi:hypothetical protein
MTSTPRIPLLGATLLILCLLVPAVGRSQTALEDALRQLTGPNGQAYMQPGADAFGAAMQAGYFHSVAIPVTGFTFEFAIVAMGVPIADDMKSATMTTPAGFDPPTFSNATLFGGTGTTVQHATIPGLSYRGPDGALNVDELPLGMFPFGVPQITIGSLFGTQATVRYIPIPKIGNQEIIPEGKLLSLGVRHNLSQWFGVLPLDLSVSYFYSTFKTGDLIDFKGNQIGVQAGKKFSVVGVYGGVAWEQSTMKVAYTYEPTTGPPSPVSLELEGENAFRVTAGVALHLGIFTIFADANLGSMTNFSGGIALGN